MLLASLLNCRTIRVAGQVKGSYKFNSSVCQCLPFSLRLQSCNDQIQDKTNLGMLRLLNYKCLKKSKKIWWKSNKETEGEDVGGLLALLAVLPENSSPSMFLREGSTGRRCCYQELK
ncbi:uncharacterized protein LOC143265476 isoform X2 [Megachile rotundata]